MALHSASDATVRPWTGRKRLWTRSAREAPPTWPTEEEATISQQLLRALLHKTIWEQTMPYWKKRLPGMPLKSERRHKKSCFADKTQLMSDATVAKGTTMVVPCSARSV